MEAVAALLGERAAAAIGADDVAVLQRDDDGLTFMAGADDGATPSLTRLVEQAIDSDKTMFVAGSVADSSPGGLLIVPIGGKAALCARWRRTVDISTEQAAVAEALRRAAGAAVENASMRERSERDAAQLHAVLDSISDCYYALDRDWNIVEFSRSAEAFFRVNRSDVIGRNLWDIFPSGRGQVYEEVCRTAMDRNENGRLEAPSAFQPGHVIELRTAPMEGGISVALTDITERRRAEADLRRQTRQLEVVLDAAPAAIWIARDAKGRHITGNRFARQLLRVDGDGNMSKSGDGADVSLGHFRVLTSDGVEIAPDDLPVQRAARGEEVLAFEERIVFDDATEVHLLGNAVPLRDRSGRLHGAVAAFSDVTHLKQVERDLTELTRTLESRIAEAVADREAALSQLHEAQKTEALGQIAGGVAHDFNNLLSPIIGGLDLLRMRKVGEARDQRLIEGAMESAERARVLVQRMLAFARRQPLQKTAVDVSVLIDDLHTLLASSVGARVRIVIDKEVGLPPALADQNQLELALLNVALNARDAMPEGGVLTIAASMNGDFIRLAMTDTGIGMDAGTLKRAAEPFFSTKGVGKGTGLGLSMVQGLAAQLGGRLELSSTPGVGTTVTLMLPATPGGSEAQESRSAPPLPRAAGNVLLVDDEAPVRESTRAMLEAFGYTVVEASCASEALSFVETGAPLDWIVTDHMMPGMTGADLVRAVRQQRPAIKVLIISGFADVDEIAPDLPRLAKPFRQADLGRELAARES